MSAVLLLPALILLGLLLGAAGARWLAWLAPLAIAIFYLVDWLQAQGEPNGEPGTIGGVPRPPIIETDFEPLGRAERRSRSPGPARDPQV